MSFVRALSAVGQRSVQLPTGRLCLQDQYARLLNDHSRLLVAVLNNPADRAKLEPLAHQDWKPEAFALGRWAAYIWCADGILASRAAAAMGKAVGDAVTTRNWTTINKLHALATSQVA